MVEFCNEVLNQILNIKDENELGNVINDSLARFRNEKNAGHEGTYIMNMIVMLRIISPSTVETRRIEIIKHALNLFRELQRENKERII